MAAAKHLTRTTKRPPCFREPQATPSRRSATKKFSSNVVEKCLKVFKEADKANIILELLSAPQFERLLLHPYANYVVYAALQNSKGSLHSALTNAIRPHVELLRTSPYCKRIYSRALLKK
uniref:Pumilio domain-containing protein n=1 Tax=Aegilops tauschii TaxID=37682 RepID=R7W660_AEGTA